ncbi:MAG: elongation factor P maturation arginine rhamnosyltransferase EarP [Burkholderiaceae bacterium]
MPPPPLADAPRLRQHALPWLPQPGYDRLLWAADLNFVRGEDSWARAQWAGRPFVWQAYRQHDGAHGAKLGAFLDRALADAPPATAQALRAWHAAWNGEDEPAVDPAGAAPAPLPAWTPALLDAAGDAARAWRARLLAGPELTERLLAFATEKR